MPLLVMKFGGTSVADLDRIRNAAAKVGREVERGYDVIVIVSAMSGETNRLLGLAKQVNDDPPLEYERELDVIASTGEQVSIGLLALALLLGLMRLTHEDNLLDSQGAEDALRHGAMRLTDDEIDQMKFSVKEIPGLTFHATYRPLIVISNNSERQLPDAFLRRCVFHYIEFPKEPDLRKILAERIAADLPKALIDGCIHHFQALREMGKRNELDKPPATAELESWIRVLLMAQVPAEQIASSELKDLPHLAALLKTQRDLERVRPRQDS